MVRMEEVDMLADVPRASSGLATLNKGTMELWGWTGEWAPQSRKVRAQTGYPH